MPWPLLGFWGGSWQKVAPWLIQSHTLLINCVEENEALEVKCAFLGSGCVSDWIPLEPDMGQEWVPSELSQETTQGQEGGSRGGWREAGPQPAPQETEQGTLQGD